jgi:hypothetical protein
MKGQPMETERITDAQGRVTVRTLPPFIPVRVTLNDGDYYDTQCRGTIDEIRRYFFQNHGLTDYGSTEAKEIVRHIVKVEQLPTPA